MKTIIGNGHAPVATFSGITDKIFQHNLGRFFNDDRRSFDGAGRSKHVPVNVKHTGNSYELEVIAPGLRKEDLKVTTSRDTLTVSFEQKQDDQASAQGWLRREYSLKSFSRTFMLNDTIDLSKIKANYDKGILRITLPEKEEAQAVVHTIEIK